VITHQIDASARGAGSITINDTSYADETFVIPGTTVHGRQTIYSMDATGQNKRQLTQGGNHTQPVWLP